MIPLGVLASARVAASGGGLEATLTDTLVGTGNQSGLTVNIGAPAAGRTVVAALAWGRTFTVSRALTDPLLNGTAPTWSSYSSREPSGFAIFGDVVASGTTATVGWVFGSGSTPGWRLMVYTVPSPLDLYAFDATRSAADDASPISVTVDSAPGDLIIASRSYGGGITFASGVTTDDMPSDSNASTGRSAATGSTHTVTATLSSADSVAGRATVGAAVLRASA